MEKNDWQFVIGEEKDKAYFKRLQQFVAAEYATKTIYPQRSDIYQAIKLTSYEATKVVILGQDPYINEGQAHGLSFSIGNPQAKFPPSLKNIFTELETDLGIKRSNINLTDWAEQGVLLLNTVLTVQAGKSASHRGQGWETFTDKIIEVLNEKESQVIFILWGADARRKKNLITNTQHKIIESVHPSPLSAHNGFFGSKPFSKVNQYLQTAGLRPIIWG